jgi:hypothetical protein
MGTRTDLGQCRADQRTVQTEDRGLRIFCLRAPTGFGGNGTGGCRLSCGLWPANVDCIVAALAAALAALVMGVAGTPADAPLLLLWVEAMSGSSML